MLTVIVVLASGVLAFLLSNLYYQWQLKSHNEERLMHMAQSIASEYERHPMLDLHEYLTLIADLNYRLYIVDEQGHGTMYGSPFKDTHPDPAIVERVRNGQPYHGVKERKHELFVTGYFENTLANSVGVPLKTANQTYVLFLRPDIESAFGELRVLLAWLLVLTFGISLIFLTILTRLLVQPIKRLTAATNQIAEGDFDVHYEIARGDEIGELARHFSKMAGELKKLEAMRQEFVSNVSHEIQSPLTSIQGFSQALRTEEMSAEEREVYLSIIESESRRLSSISQQLLTLAALDKGNAALDKTEYRLDEQLREVALMLEWQWQEKDLHLELELPDVTVRADRQLLHLVWINLLTNSIKFTEAGGAITLQLSSDVGEVHLLIRDTGIGIAAAELPHIFDRFYKADKSRNRNRSGSGLGLSIVQKIIRQHRGQIEVDSTPGIGTTFLIRLPRL
ncbi:HAMP domain-containing sensor histidine kinase [Tumebacillus sp. DT12]|uniref:Heme sensor protein HssS n=1 Tax=Tumebacillus lacus TaxID=2995335 RepID=A0ABT3WVQ4_9BACL|nr:HAMP domain-containing sensor histidine kinase [Tumebacillus lacus]MCX7568758.1 HAMP domain-containing sensor histidine kinase [Tumebacillus lacus]